MKIRNRFSVHISFQVSPKQKVFFFWGGGATVARKDLVGERNRPKGPNLDDDKKKVFQEFPDLNDVRNYFRLASYE